MDAHEKDIAVEGPGGLLSDSEHRHLLRHLGQETLREVLSMLAQFEDPLRRALAEAVCERAEEFGEQALLLALADVAHMTEGQSAAGSERD